MAYGGVAAAPLLLLLLPAPLRPLELAHHLCGGPAVELNRPRLHRVQLVQRKHQPHALNQRAHRHVGSVELHAEGQRAHLTAHDCC